MKAWTHKGRAHHFGRLNKAAGVELIQLQPALECTSVATYSGMALADSIGMIARPRVIALSWGVEVIDSALYSTSGSKGRLEAHIAGKPLGHVRKRVTDTL